MTTVSARLFQPDSRLAWSWCDFSGADAADFLQRLTTVGVPNLQPGKGVPGAFLNPQGKIRSFFQLWRLGKDSFAFELAAGKDSRWTRALTETIDFYTFGEKIKLSAREDLECVWVFPEHGSPENLQQLGETLEQDGVRVCKQGPRNFGRSWWTVWGTRKNLDAWTAAHLREAGSALTSEELNTWRIETVAPAIDAEITEEAGPLEIGLRAAIADNKGCYPGQEIIEKIISLGSPPRRLIQLRLAPGGQAQIGDAVLDASGAEVGKVTSTSKTHALAIVRKTLAKENLEAQIGSQTSHPKARVTKVAPY